MSYGSGNLLCSSTTVTEKLHQFFWYEVLLFNVTTKVIRCKLPLSRKVWYIFSSWKLVLKQRGQVNSDLNCVENRQVWTKTHLNLIAIYKTIIPTELDSWMKVNKNSFKHITHWNVMQEFWEQLQKSFK